MLTRAAHLALLLLSLAASAGCSTYSKKLEDFRREYGSADFAEADATVDHLIASKNGVDAEEVARRSALGVVDAKKGDNCLFLLEKGMTRLASGDPAHSVAVFRASRDVLDQRFRHDAANIFKSAASLALDDTVRDYEGADYEHVLIRVMLCLGDLMQDGGDSYAYAVQIGEKQEEILKSEYGKEQGYNPREHYRRMAIGAYLQGVIREASLDPDEAVFAYKRAKSYLPGSHVIAEALGRAEARGYAEPGHGVLHVFYLAGRAPYLGETTHPVTELSRLLAGAAMTIAAQAPAALFQTPVLVPAVRVQDRPAAPLVVRSGEASAATERILDVNQVAREQLDANMPWILARAVARRTLKAAAAGATEKAIDAAGTRRQKDGERREDVGVAVLGFLAGAAVNLASTAAENADTRSWISLPAEVQVARLELPEGLRDVSFGDGMTARLAIAAGRDAYVLVLRPNLNRPGLVLVDPRSVPPAGPPQQTAPTPPPPAQPPRRAPAPRERKPRTTTPAASTPGPAPEAPGEERTPTAGPGDEPMPAPEQPEMGEGR